MTHLRLTHTGQCSWCPWQCTGRRCGCRWHRRCPKLNDHVARTSTGRASGNDRVEPTELRIAGIKDMDGVEALRLIVAAEDNEAAAATGSADGRGGMVRPRTRSRTRNFGIRPFPSGGVEDRQRVLPLVVLDATKDNQLVGIGQKRGRVSRPAGWNLPRHRRGIPKHDIGIQHHYLFGRYYLL